MLGGNLGSLLYGDVSVMNITLKFSTPMQHFVIFTVGKKTKNHMKKGILFLLFFTHNINGYSLELHFVD